MKKFYIQTSKRKLVWKAENQQAIEEMIKNKSYALRNEDILSITQSDNDLFTIDDIKLRLPTQLNIVKIETIDNLTFLVKSERSFDRVIFDEDGDLFSIATIDDANRGDEWIGTKGFGSKAMSSAVKLINAKSHTKKVDFICSRHDHVTPPY